MQADEKHFIQEHDPHFTVFPTLPVNIAFKRTDRDVSNFVERIKSEPVPGTPPFDPRRSIDGERSIEIINALPASSEGLDLEIRSAVIGVYDTGGAMISEQTHDLVDAGSGTVYAKMTSTAFGIGQGGYDGPKWPSKSVARMPPGRPDFVHKYRTTPETARLYRQCGDDNSLTSTDDDDNGMGGKRAAGFVGGTLQSLCTWNIAAHGLLRTVAGSDPSRLKLFGARFQSPVYPGDELETWIWKIDSEGGYDNYVFETIIKGEVRVALSNGYAKIRQGERSKL